MKILHYINNLGSGGAEKLLTDIIPEMEKQGNTVHVLIANGNQNFQKYVELLNNKNIEVNEIGTSFYNPFQIISLIKFIKRNNIDIVHAHLFPTQYWLAIASVFISKKVKLIKTEHSVFNERKNYKFLRPIEKWIYSRYSTTIAITDKVKENLQGWIGKSCPIITIKNGVNLKQIQSEIYKGTTLKLNNSRFSILMVGRFDGSQKDQLSLVKALKFLPNDVSIYFAGEGNAIEQVKATVQDMGLLDQVVFLGLRSDIYAIMNNVDLNVLSTNHEGLSGVALESLASGKPFIGSDVEGVQEVVPSADYLFTPKNPEELAAKILNIINNQQIAQNMVDQALEHVKAYDTSIMVSGYLTIYYQLLNKPKDG